MGVDEIPHTNNVNNTLNMLLVEFVALEKWLKEHKPRLYKELHETDKIEIDDAKDISKKLDKISNDINRIP